MTAPITATVDVSGALANLNLLSKYVKDLRPVFAGPINKLVDSYFIRQFASEGAFAGTPWKRLAPVSIVARAQRGRGRGGIGRDTNRLWDSLTKFGLGPDALKVVTPNSLTRGTKVPYAQWFAGGWTSKTVPIARGDKIVAVVRRKREKRIPGRPLVPTEGLPRTLIAVAEKTITRYLESGNAG